MDISSSVLVRFRFKFELEVKGDGGIEGGGGVKAEVKRLLRLLNKSIVDLYKTREHFNL